MRFKTLSLVAVATSALISTNLLAQGSGSGPGVSGSSGFQVGGITVSNNTSSTAMAFTVPADGGQVSATNTTGGVTTIRVGDSGSAISQLGGTYGGPGIYVLTDAAGNVVTIVVGEGGEITAIDSGDTSSQY
jgi:hypothetical protein